MVLYNTDFVSGKEIETIQMVKGIGVDCYAKCATQEAEIRMIESAMELQADAIINVRYVLQCTEGGSDVAIVSGTAVRFVEDERKKMPHKNDDCRVKHSECKSLGHTCFTLKGEA